MTRSPWSFAALVLATLLLSSCGNWFAGDDAGPEATASAQGVMDAGSTDFPIEVVELRQHEFASGRWQEWRLRARETGAEFTAKVHDGENPAFAARQHFKIARDGQRGKPSWELRLPSDLPGVLTERSRVEADGPPSPVEFSTREPYDFGTQPIKTHLVMSGQHMTSSAGHAQAVRGVADWANREGRSLTRVELQQDVDEPLPRDSFVVSGAALTATDLASRLDSAKAGRPAAGVTYQRVG